MLWAYSMMGRKLCSVRPPFDNDEGSISTQQVSCSNGTIQTKESPNLSIRIKHTFFQCDYVKFFFFQEMCAISMKIRLHIYYYYSINVTI